MERSVWIRPSKRHDFLELATRGVTEGTVTAGGKSMAALRFDRDSNGRWFDAGDRVVLDNNGDGHVDPIGGRISCDSVCQIDGKRFVMQSDAQGERLALVELSGTGTVVPQVGLETEDAVFSELNGAFVSRSGVRAPIRGMDQAVQCPVGEYRIESLTFEFAHDGRKYWFRFSALDLADHPIVVTADQTVSVDLLGQITLGHQQAAMNE